MSAPSQSQPSAPPSKPPGPTIEQATYRNTKQILATLAPLAGLAERTAGTDTEEGWGEMLLATLSALLEGQARLREGLEALHARLDTPTLEAALRAAVRD